MTESRKKKPERYSDIPGHYSTVMAPDLREKLAEESQCDTRTVIRWLRGLEVRPSILARIDAAAKALKVYGKKGRAA